VQEDAAKETSNRIEHTSFFPEGASVVTSLCRCIRCHSPNQSLLQTRAFLTRVFTTIDNEVKLVENARELRIPQKGKRTPEVRKLA
jgi:hypothetical protein